MFKTQFNVNVANGIAFIGASDILLVWLMELYPDLFNKSKSLLHIAIK